MQNIQYSFHSNVSTLEMQFDIDKIDKIMYNLLSNAFKFTPEGGIVTVNIEYLAHDQRVNLIVADSGIGIEPEKQEKIFEQFFHSESITGIGNNGTGIGLALVKEFVRLHKGTITVESNVGKGSKFIVSIPANLTSKIISQDVEEQISDEFQHAKIFANAEETSKQDFTLLIIEDNHDLRFYLKDNLRNKYNIIEASRGLEGMQKAFDYIPDLIVCDILLPEISGLDICKNLKNDKRTSHIPIILLTSQTDTNIKIQGFELGADEYITKPFSYEILEARIKNLILQREKFKKLIDKHFDISPSAIEVVSEYEKFVKKAIELVEKNIENPDFSVEEFSREMGMSRVHLYKKILSLTGKTPIEFIRIIRLKRAAQLLQNSQLNISEIAYQVGFNNPKYFAKYFKDEFGVLPSVFAKKKSL